MTLSPKVAVVILNWNGKTHLEEFMPSVVDTQYANIELIVADNGSTDDSVKYLSESFPQIRIILIGKNRGFAAGYNEALKLVEADYFVLLNSDVKVEPNWIEPVIRMMESQPSVAAAQPKILSHANPDYFEHAGASGGYLDMFGYPFCRGRIFDSIEKDQGQYDSQVEIFWASGAAFFIRKSAWEAAGGFDPDFFAHMEEIDLCWRLKNMGMKVMVCPQARVYHLGGGSLNAESPYKTYLNFRNNLIMLQKNLPFLQALAVIFVRFWLDLIALMKFLAEGKMKHARAVSKAHVDFFRNISRTGKKASEIKTDSFNPAGFYNRSMIWAYFVEKKKSFSEL